VTSKFEFIDGEKAYFPIVKMCRWLGVSKSRYYEWRSAPLSMTARRREDLKLMIQRIFDDSHETYGHRRIHAILIRSGHAVGLELVRRLMRDLGLVACQPRPWRPITTEGQEHRIPDLVGRDFTADAPGLKLVGDITYIQTGEGWLYLATWIDCFSKMVAGWSMADHYKTPLICSALDMAANSIELADECIFHSDRGSNYTSYEFAKELKGRGFRQSVGRTGVCWDNAMAESFFGALKNEWIHRMTFATRAEARSAVVQYIEGFYNRTRIHSGIDYRTPMEVHNGYADQQRAA
jgi:putative transposase